MKIAVVHYHLRRGGVTNVIQSAGEALRGTGADLLVITGEAPDVGVAVDNVIVIPGLNYRKTAYHSVGEGLKDALKDAAESYFGSQPDVWHFHNHSLGKNVLMPLVVTGLAEEKARILLQMHDFPEDGRPQNYVSQRSFFDLEKEFARTLYPQASHVHYATINQRDRNFLKAAGLKSDLIHLLPNRVSGIVTETTPAERPFCRDRQFVLYPSRGIRRKNIGELILLSLAHRANFEFGVSLAPENPEWIPVYKRWEKLAGELNLPIRFALADQYSFPDLIGWSDAFITTSVAEGFGLAFLEPWLAHKGVVGRDLPRITEDFTKSGISLDHLYERIDIPLDWIDESALRAEADAALRRIYLAYNCPLPRKAVDQAFSRWIVDGHVDFGMLNEDFQIKIIQKAVADLGALKELQLPSLEGAPAHQLERNENLVAEHFSLESYREKLLSTYRRVGRSSAGRVKQLVPGKVLGQFLDPWRLNLLRT